MRIPHFIFLTALLSLFSWSLADKKFVAILETLSNFEDDASIGRAERMYITDKLRENAVKILNNENFIVMTRENINVMMNPDIPIEACEGECLVSTGRNIGANFVSQARIGQYSNKYTITVEMYETQGASLISSFTAVCQNSDEILEAIDEKAYSLFDPILPTIEPPPEPKEPIEVSPNIDKGYEPIQESHFIPESIPPKQPSEEKQIHWLPIILSSAVLAGGTALAIIKNNEAKDLSEKDDPKSENDYKKRISDIDDAQNMRALGIGIAILGGIGLTISVAF